MQLERLGPYRIGPKLGKGGMGSVYQATDVHSGERVAVKALAPQLAAAEGFRERFEAEIESLKKLQHEGIVRLYGYGEDNGVLFYSMELVEGPSLEQELIAGRRFDWNETLSIAIQVCRALKHAHDHGIIHRDVKPANLLLAKGDRVKIADFGIARLFGATQLTTAGGILGTADYMSPEQVDGRPVTDRCDQYALGSVMFALLAGRPPFRAKTMPEMLQLQRFAEPEPVRRYAPQTPEQLDRLISQLLSKDPAQRFPNALVLARHMEAMQKALSRPAKHNESPGRPALQVTDADATAAPATDRTMSYESLDLRPLETADSDVYDAPTLADEVPASAPSAATPPAGRPVEAVPRSSRFTTIEEDSRRTQRERPELWSLVLQLAGLVAALAALGWLGWRITRPATADALYAEIIASLEENDGDPAKSEDEITEFLERFPQDSRAAEIQVHADELELRRLERSFRARSRLGGAGPWRLAERVYAEAVAVMDADPFRAKRLLEDLLALYADAEGAEHAGPMLTLARRQLDRLRASLDAQARDQLPELADRLQAARLMERSDATAAAAMYQALVNLYDESPWAEPIVDEARQRLLALAHASE